VHSGFAPALYGILDAQELHSHSGGQGVSLGDPSAGSGRSQGAKLVGVLDPECHFLIFRGQIFGGLLRMPEAFALHFVQSFMPLYNSQVIVLSYVSCCDLQVPLLLSVSVSLSLSHSIF
jgi:hypothetical protein